MEAETFSVVRPVHWSSKALKRRLHQQHGLPPRFRQRLLHEGNALDDAVTLDSLAAVMDPEVVATSSSEASEKSGELAVACKRGSAGEGALKRRLDSEDGLPPRCRQRLLLKDKSSNASVELDTRVDLQVVVMAFSEASARARGQSWGRQFS